MSDTPSTKDSRMLAWAYLARVFEGPSRHLQALLQQGEDVEKIAHGIQHREPWLGEILHLTRSRYQDNRAKEDLALMEKLGGRLVTVESPEWPTFQFAQGFAYAELNDFQHVSRYEAEAVEPHCLWVRGMQLDVIAAKAVAIVGTRAVSSYGARATRTLATGLAQQGYAIISGGALGVDTHAHQAALDAQGITAVLLARGVDAAYPAANAGLFRKVVEQGAVISEYPPGATPHRHRFLARNRLVAALSQGVVVTEAPYRSGALNTLSWAAALGRQAMGVPGPIDVPNSLGVHERIRAGEAHLVSNAGHVDELIGHMGVGQQGERVGSEAAQLELDLAPTATQKLNYRELRVFDSVDYAPMPTDAIAKEAGLPVGLCVKILLDLEREGLVRRDRSNWLRSRS
ncbi:DNA-processing protein DprA [Corynebacterium kozikiae]|uniref:DNA-processing protein DprA n=1 Tax=Corynebacterium kozikiae TaxID=2968469 RepID=UPI00211C7EAF|nr:DNA-processing protein DprA [Corynebacterium sp. 76QC2CO]MCQ9342376.1 DNA-processing protein DprA [Corynebacterium sp. 76QC2CO]